MKRSLIRCAALACAAAALALTSAGALAQATITLSDPNCLDFTFGGSAGARTLTCVQSNTPLCTVSGPTAGTIGTPIALNSTCVPAATTGYAWTGGHCAGILTKGCTDPGTGYTNGQVVSYTVTGTNAAGAGPASAAWQVTWTNTLPAPPSACSISGAPSGSQTAGVQVTLTINCTSGGAATSWSWNSAASSATTQTVGPITVNQTTTFTATASNAGGTSAPASAIVQIGGSTIACSGFASTLVEHMTWGSNVVAYSSPPGFTSNGALVVQFTTPSFSTPPTAGKANIGTVEFSGPPALRRGALSTTACDFTVGNGQAPPLSSVFNEIEPTLNFTVGYQKSGYFELQPNTTYYLNMYNPDGCAPDSNCDVKITLQNNER